MKQREVKQTITYRWWKPDRSEIKTSHIEELDEVAEKRIAELRTEGCTSGDLIANLCLSNEDPNEGIDYNGWWEIDTVVL
ncbi:MAG: hypothetical protein ACTSW1_07460 [Candidatus Hodarchaeales archaeon]